VEIESPNGFFNVVKEEAEKRGLQVGFLEKVNMRQIRAIDEMETRLPLLELRRIIGEQSGGYKMAINAVRKATALAEMRTNMHIRKILERKSNLVVWGVGHALASKPYLRHLYNFEHTTTALEENNELEKNSRKLFPDFYKILAAHRKKRFGGPIKNRIKQIFNK
jgi:hypothetical protein